jgi:phospholipase/carboxylesterase
MRAWPNVRAALPRWRFNENRSPPVDRRTFALAASASLLVGAGAHAAAQAGPLDGPRRAAPRPPAKFLIVLLHGFGSNGADMISLADNFQRYVPTAACVAPNAPYAIEDGYSWFPARGPSAGGGQRAPAPTSAAAPRGLEAFIDAELARHGLGPERLILIGFSQGASTALNTGLRRKVPPAAIVAFSGANLSPDGLARGSQWPPVLLVQGDQDPRVPTGAQARAVQLLKDLGAPVTAHMLRGLGHGIDERGIELAGELIRSVT